MSALSAKSTAAAENGKAANGWTKPYQDFPLCYHKSSGRFYKSIRGKFFSFGYADRWQEAVEAYHRCRSNSRN